MRKDVGMVKKGNIICVHKTKTMGQAYKIMQEFAARHLPVVDDEGAIVGMLSDRDMKRAMMKDPNEEWSAKDFEPQFSPDDIVYEYMSWPVQCIDESHLVSQAAEIMIEKKISSLIVKRNAVAVGIVTSEDLLKLLVHEHKNVKPGLKDNIVGIVFSSPIGGIAQMLANIGI